MVDKLVELAELQKGRHAGNAAVSLRRSTLARTFDRRYLLELERLALQRWNHSEVVRRRPWFTTAGEPLGEIIKPRYLVAVAY